MPTYEYECSECKGHFEFFQSISEKPKDVCEACGGKLTKLLSAGTGLIFKGSGFYITDYKPKGSDGSTGAKEAKTEGSSESSDSKPAGAAKDSASSAPASSGTKATETK